MKTEEEIKKRLEFLEDLKSKFFQVNNEGIQLGYDKKMKIVQEIGVLKWTLGMIEEKNSDVKKTINFPNHETFEEKVIKIFLNSSNPLTSADIGLMLNLDYRNINNIFSKLILAKKIILVEGMGIKNSPRKFVWNKDEKTN